MWFIAITVKVCSLYSYYFSRQNLFKERISIYKLKLFLNFFNLNIYFCSFTHDETKVQHQLGLKIVRIWKIKLKIIQMITFILTFNFQENLNVWKNFIVAREIKLLDDWRLTILFWKLLWGKSPVFKVINSISPALIGHILHFIIQMSGAEVAESLQWKQNHNFAAI